MVMMPVDRCQSGIPGFDKLCQGGFVRNSISAVIGGPGSGKTTFLLQFLWDGMQKGENGLYLSFEPDVSEVMQDAYTYGWDFAKFDQQGRCKFIKLSPASSERELEKQLIELVAKHEVKRLCFDPVSVFAMTLEKESTVREAIYTLCSLLKRLKVTVLLAEEVHGDPSMDGLGGGSYRLSRHGVIEFITDSVITLHSMGIGGETDRAVRIVKMRRTNHARGPIPMKITNKGILVAERG
ncbi:AAA family ATPase [Candidatus Pacearchaeota archaeon]|nr:AAA family ATPase [Candidatus Pacearchaeota archaeon]